MKTIQNICGIFSGLSEEELKVLTEKLILCKYHKKEYVLRAGKKNKDIYIIKSGIVKREAYYDGKKYTLDFLKKGDFFGEVGAFTSGTVAASTICITDCEFLKLKQADIDILVARSPVFVYNMLHAFASAVQKDRAKAENLAFKTVKRRIVDTLLYLVSIFRGNEGEGLFIDLPISQQEIANFVGSARENVGRILSTLKAEKVIEIQTKKIIILDEERLEKMQNEYM